MSKACLGQYMSNFKIISKNMEPVMKKPNFIEMKKPLAVGSAIIELSKLFMYQSYDKIRGHFEHDNLKLFFSDTDSFLFSVKLQESKWWIKIDPAHVRFFKIQKDHELFDNSRANTMFYFKDEMKWKAAIT